MIHEYLVDDDGMITGSKLISEFDQPNGPAQCNKPISVLFDKKNRPLYRMTERGPEEMGISDDEKANDKQLEINAVAQRHLRESDVSVLRALEELFANQLPKELIESRRDERAKIKELPKWLRQNRYD
jgi:hypothetical protein